MRTRNKVIIIIIGVLLVAFLAMAAWGFYSLLTGRIFGYHPPPTPAELQQPRVTVGQEFLLQRKFVELSFLESMKSTGPISDVAVGEFDAHPGLDVVLSGSLGAAVYDRNGAPQSRTNFQLPIEKVKIGPFNSDRPANMLGDVQVVDLEGDGNCEYLARGSIDGAAVFAHDGKLIWSYGRHTKEKTSIHDLTVGDLDGDHVAELVASWDGIEVFDKSGKRRSAVTEKYGPTQIEIIDTDGNGKNEIVSIGGNLEIRDATGRIVKSVSAPVYLGNFCLSKMPGRKQAVILGIHDGTLLLIDFNGEVVAQFDAPLSNFEDTVDQTPFGEVRGTSVYKSKGIWVKLVKDQPEYLAVITNFAALDRSVLDVFTPAGKLVYQEVLPEECQSIAILPAESQSGVDEFLVSGKRSVWTYGKK